MSVISFGVNKQSQLGHIVEKDHLDPTVIQLLAGKRIVQACCGEAHSLAITEFGDCFSWGRGREGELGHPERHATYLPTIVSSLEHERIVKVACGNFHSLAITDTGKVYEWGQLHEIDNSKSTFQTQSGLVEMHGIGHASKIAEQSLSRYLNGDKKAYDGDNATVNSNPNQQKEEEEDLTNKEEEYDNNNEQSKGKHIGKIIDKNQITPMLHASLRGKEIIDISAGWAYSAAVSRSGHLYTWGFNEKGQLGLGDRWFHGLPQHVHFMTDVKIKAVSCGRQHICVVSSTGDLFSFGLGVFGQLGHGKLKSYLHPKKVLEFSEETKINQKVQQVACGANFTMVITVDGRLWSFGHGEYGQLGATEESQFRDWNRGANGSEREDHLKYSLPKQVEALANVKIRSVTCGHLHTIAVTDDNDVYSWGWGSSGCLGFGDKKFQLVPQRVPSLSGELISSVSAGEKHSLIVRATDTTTFAFDYRSMLNDKRHSDITFLIQGKKAFANKFIIKSRCPKLYGMIILDNRYCNDQVSTVDGSGSDDKQVMRTIEIKNVKYQIFTSFLTYLYTDHLVVPPHLRKELSDLATHYGVHRLAALCQRYNYRLRMTGGDIPLSTFSSDITQYLGDYNYTDIHFKLSNHEIIPCHKSILSSRNQYFKTMFECGFKERDQIDFKIGEDIDKETFKLLIEYIYGSNESIVNQDNAIDLLCQSDRFMVLDLKLVTEHYLRQVVQSNISTIKSYINQSTPHKPSTKPPNNINAIVEDDSLEKEDEPLVTLEDSIAAFDSICLLLQVADRFMAKRLKRMCMDTIAIISPSHFDLFNKNQTLKLIRNCSPQLIRELDYYASTNYGIDPNHIMQISR